MTSFKKRAVDGLDRALQPGAQEEIPSFAYTPTEPLDLGITAGTGVGLPWAFSKMMKKPISLGRSAAIGFGPVGTPIAGAMDAAGILMGPLADPEYQAGNRGYLEAVRASAQRNMEQIGRGSAEARRKYGLMGVPAQAVHGVFNPVSSTLYLAKNLRDYLSTKEGQDNAQAAEYCIARALGS